MNLNRASIPDLAVLQAFEAAARHGNFTKAAAELSLTQSAVSRQVRTLEVLFGVPLFERSRQRVHLSVAGRQVLPGVQRLLAQSEELVVKARSAVAADGRLSIAALPTFCNRWLMPRLPTFLASRPGLTVEIASRSAPFDLHEADVDIAIHFGQPVWANATCTYLCSEVILPVAAPALARPGDMRTAGDVARLPLLHLTTRPMLWAEWFRACGTGDQVAYRGSRFDQFSTVIEAALGGLGAALLPTYLIETELASGALEVILDLPMSTENGYYVVLPDGRRQGSAGFEFQEWLIGQVRRP
ncbi:LysR family transcriptional regulator [Aquibium microcysteis]|uniref:LysR family transcriptional regulator n=1 Tax=Aquibium microcysteis TaxID=675281 RepID=UPI00165D253A|nr:LysR family transcriptional regulator [Aquibium microcysteis]